MALPRKRRKTPQSPADKLRKLSVPQLDKVMQQGGFIGGPPPSSQPVSEEDGLRAFSNLSAAAIAPQAAPTDQTQPQAAAGSGQPEVIQQSDFTGNESTPDLLRRIIELLERMPQEIATAFGVDDS